MRLAPGTVARMLDDFERLRGGASPPSYPARPKNGGLLPLAVAAGCYPVGLDDVVFEPKVNGWRLWANSRTHDCFNRHNQPLSIRSEFQVALGKLDGCGGVFPWWDCEGLERRHNIGRGSLILLDHLGNGTLAGERQFEVETWGKPFDWQDPRLEENELYRLPRFTLKEALVFWEIAPLINATLGCTFYEGVVSKRSHSNYPTQLRSPTEETPLWVKHRFTNK